jgi:hypothetical protein
VIFLYAFLQTKKRLLCCKGDSLSPKTGSYIYDMLWEKERCPTYKSLGRTVPNFLNRNFSNFSGTVSPGGTFFLKIHLTPWAVAWETRSCLYTWSAGLWRTCAMFSKRKRNKKLSRHLSLHRRVSYKYYSHAASFGRFKVRRTDGRFPAIYYANKLSSNPN